MMDRYEAMSLFVMVTEKGSLSAASRALQVPLATLSRKVADLESLLGAKLLIRTTRKLTLTDAGVAYLAAARRILDLVEDAEREAAGEFSVPKGELVITAPMLFGNLHVVPLVADFLASFTQINIRLVLADRNVQLIDDHVDMAVRIGNLPDSTLVATRVGSMRTVMCASPALLASYGMPNSPSDLLRFPCVMLDTPVPSPVWQFGAPESSATLAIQPQPRLWVTTAEAAVRAAIHDVGVTRLFYYQVAEALEVGALQIILEAFEPEPVPVNLVHASRGQLPLKMRRFLDFAAPRLREALGSLSRARSATRRD
jgi:DNA-binding transcriptional LysR family regulator